MIFYEYWLYDCDKMAMKLANERNISTRLLAINPV